jgi:hypothetical protein
MHSSTSSFERAVPRGAWHATAAIALVIFVATMAAWEARVRSEGYEPSLNDSNDLWAQTRSRVSDDPGQTVIVGSSRILFDFDLATWTAAAGGRQPVQLAMPGSNPVAVLEDVAASGFRGDLILGVTPGLWFVPEGPPVKRSATALGRYRNWSPSQRAGLALGLPLQRRLALINADDLTLAALLGRVRFADRPGAIANLPPRIPPYFAATDDSRQARMWRKCDFGTPLAARIQQIWPPLFTPPPPPPNLSPEEFQARLAANADAHLERIRASVASIRSRGGRVVFVRPPSTGALRQLEQRYSPREAVWDRMLAVTGAPGIHFEDHSDLARFDCPEWSHLTSADAVRYSEALVPLVIAALEGQGGRRLKADAD